MRHRPASNCPRINSCFRFTVRFLMFVRASSARPDFAFLLALLLTLTIGAQDAFARSERGAEPGEFDYYTLSLSWSPTHCELEGDRNGDEQCTGARPYAFVLHGLWPQYERDWPEFCRTRRRPWVPQSLIDRMLDIMPSPRLVIHQYRKHGTCSGLSPEAYYEASRQAYESIRIPEKYRRLQEPLMVSPDEVEEEFLAANPQLEPDMIEVTCNRNRLREVRICFTRGLKPRKCGDNELGRRLCNASRVRVPPVRYRRPSGI